MARHAHEYQRRIARAIADGLNGQPGAVASMLVLHDKACPLLRDGSACDCDPDIALQLEDGRMCSVGRCGELTWLAP